MAAEASPELTSWRTNGPEASRLRAFRSPPPPRRVHGFSSSARLVHVDVPCVRGLPVHSGRRRAGIARLPQRRSPPTAGAEGGHGGGGVGGAGRAAPGGAGGEAGTPVLLQSEEEQDEGDDAQQRSEHDGALVRGEVAHHAVEAEGDGLQILTRDHHQREEEVVPRRDEDEQEDRHHRRAEKPQHDREEDPRLPRSVDAGSFQQFGRHRRLRVDHAEEHTERRHRRGDDDRPDRVRQSEGVELDVERHGQQRDGEQESGHDHPHRDALARKGELRDRIAGHDSEQGADHAGAHGVQHRVADPPPEQPLRPAHQAVVVGVEVPVREPEAEGRGEVGVVLRRRDDEPVHRDQEIQRGDDERDDAERASRWSRSDRGRRSVRIAGASRSTHGCGWGCGDEARGGHASPFRRCSSAYTIASTPAIRAMSRE